MQEKVSEMLADEEEWSELERETEFDGEKIKRYLNEILSLEFMS